MNATARPIISVRGLRTWFPVRRGVLNRVAAHVKALDDVDLDIRRGEILGLVGESGCGKTTLGKTLLQLIRASAGTILYHDDGDSPAVDLATLSMRELAPYRQRLQIVFQDPHSSLNPAFTIFGSLEDPLRQCGIHSRAERRRLVGDLLEAVNLQRDAMDRYPHEFSGGQRQRIGIARALTVDPELIVCDEAVSALDVSIQAQVLQLLLDLKAERGLTYLFITHDLSVAEYLCERIAVMYLGKIVELTDTATLFRDTRHPYSRALLSAVPVADPDVTSHRIVLPGDVPSPLDPPSGCAFHPRCPMAIERCRHQEPELRRIDCGGVVHQVRCHLADDPVAIPGQPLHQAT